MSRGTNTQNPAQNKSRLREAGPKRDYADDYAAQVEQAEVEAGFRQKAPRQRVEPPTRQSRTQAERQVKFRCSERFFQRIKSECIKRELSLQELATNALKVYFQAPVEWNTAHATFLSFDDEQENEQHDWVSLWVKYFSKMPREKVLLMVEVMKLDLLHYGSSRRKVDLRKRREAGRQESKS